MAISTYAELKTAVANWLARDDLTSRIPEFIRLSEAKLNRELRCYQMEKRSTALVNTSSDEPEFVALPLDFQTMRRLRLNGVEGKPSLEFMSGTQMDEYRRGTANVTGQPKYFTVFGTEIELCPTPDDAYTLEMVFRANLDALEEDDDTNWLLDLAPDAYLYGALLEAMPYTDNDRRVQLWAAAYSQVIESLNRLSADAAYGSGPLVMRTSTATP